ncbi:MAG: polysaccharide deacetylase family protein [Candidatus Eremiobacteraeota bacterium]|nr:polysaccharide deacetylase family protein [Candidatus Eremiobacteraeota bacterium]
MKVCNFLFHRVSPSSEAWSTAISPGRLRSILQLIKRIYRVCSLEEAYDQASCGSMPLATLTFDDGFREDIEYAAPILESLKLTACFFLVVDSVESGRPNWSYELPRLFHLSVRRRLQIDCEHPGVLRGNFNFASSDALVAFGRTLISNLSQVPHTTASDIYQQIRMQLDDVAPSSTRMLSWSEARQLTGRGFEIGSHTYTHPFLSKVGDDAELAFELGESRQKFGQELGSPPQTIAYPFGDYDQRVAEAAKTSGYRLGFRVGQVFADSSSKERWCEPRVDLYADSSWLVTVLRILGYLEPLKRVLRR